MRPEPESLPSPALLSRLADEISQLEGWRAPGADERVSTGCRALDDLLPARGLRRGTLVEWLAARAGGGAGAWALGAAAEACRAGGAVVVVDRRRSFYAPAAVAWGIALENLILVRPEGRAEEEWTLDQILRSPGVAAVVAWPQRLDDHTFRRLQLSAQTQGVLGLLVRGESARRAPSWADVRLGVEPLGGASSAGEAAGVGANPCGAERGEPALPSVSPARRFRIEILRARGGCEGQTIEASLDEERGVFHASEASPVRLATALAAGAFGRRSSGA